MVVNKAKTNHQNDPLMANEENDSHLYATLQKIYGHTTPLHFISLNSKINFLLTLKNDSSHAVSSNISSI